MVEIPGWVELCITRNTIETLARGSRIAGHGSSYRKADYVTLIAIRRIFGVTSCMCLVANWFNLVDEVCEDALYDIPAFRDVCQIDLWRERVPDATTLRHLPEAHEIGAAYFAKVSEQLSATRSFAFRPGDS